MQGENAFAYQELLKGIVMQNGETRQALQQPVLTAQRDYLSEKLEFEAYKLRMRKLLNLVSTLFFLLLLVVLVYVFVRIFRRYKKESQQVISHLKREKHKIEEENGRITLALQQLDKDKKNADQTIAMLRVEIDNEKEENRQKMKTLILQLEEDSRVNAESIMRLRSELENREEEYRLYVQNAETEAKALLDDNRRMMFQKVELLKHVLEQVVAVVLLHERKYIKEKTKEKKIEEGIQSLKTDYYAGDAEYRKVEALVNRYLDNVMVHFRKEVHLANESEYRRVCYMFAGVSGQVIGEIMDESKDAVYQRRSRLLKKIGSLSCAHKGMFILLMSK
jgi:Na+-transporting methylmalonyl-CoA/oxaloacetate decarboxylase gamma subunit